MAEATMARPSSVMTANSSVRRIEIIVPPAPHLSYSSCCEQGSDDQFLQVLPADITRRRPAWHETPTRAARGEPAPSVPTGPDWIHEVKFDGYRVQAHKYGTDVVIFSAQRQRLHEPLRDRCLAAPRPAGQVGDPRRRARGQ